MLSALLIAADPAKAGNVLSLPAEDQQIMCAQRLEMIAWRVLRQGINNVLS